MENFSKIHPMDPNPSFSGLVDYDNYRHMRLRKAVSMGNGVYLIKKVEAADTAEALQEIYRMLQSGEIWIAKKSAGQYAGVGIEDKVFKSIVKERIIEGVVILEDISKKKSLRNLTEDEYTEIKKSIQNAINFLKKQPPKSNPPEINKKKKSEIVDTHVKENNAIQNFKSAKFSKPASKKKTLKLEKNQLSKNKALLIQQSNNRKAKKAKELYDEEHEKARRIEQENLNWEIKQTIQKKEDVKKTNK